MGNLPQITTYLKTTLNAPCMHFPMGQASDRAHLQNERIRLRNLRTGKDVLVDFFAAIAQGHIVDEQVQDENIISKPAVDII